MPFIYTFCIRIEWKMHLKLCWTYTVLMVMKKKLSLNNIQLWVLCFSQKIISGDPTAQLSTWIWSPRFTSLSKMIWLVIFLINWTRWQSDRCSFMPLRIIALSTSREQYSQNYKKSLYQKIGQSGWKYVSFNKMKFHIIVGF